MWRAIWILYKANLKVQLKSKITLFSNILVPLGFMAVFALQIPIFYQINPHGFKALTMPLFYVSVLGSQLIFLLSYDRSYRQLANKVLTSELDIIILKPVNFLLYKYFRATDPIILFMIGLHILGMELAVFKANMDSVTHMKLWLFILIVSLLFVNFRAAYNGLVFFTRDRKHISGLDDSLRSFTGFKPPEVFPVPVALTLTYLLPYMVVQNYIFDLVRMYDNHHFWIITIFWTVISMLLNFVIWNKGLKRYESVG